MVKLSRDVPRVKILAKFIYGRPCLKFVLGERAGVFSESRRSNCTCLFNNRYRLYLITCVFLKQWWYIHGLMQNCGNSSADVLDYQSCAKTIDMILVGLCGRDMSPFLSFWKYISNVIWKNICRSDVQVTFELHGHFRCLHVLYSK